MKVLVTGARGLLGTAIVREFSRDCDVLALGRGELDVTRADAVDRMAREARPHAIVNCAAYNDVDRAEDDAAAALEANAFAVLNLARAARRHGAALVHYSTDFVFDGESDRPYTEADDPNPRSVYGSSKLLGDWFALEHPRAWVLRVESLFGDAPEGTRRGSLGTLVDRIRRGEEVPVFVDRTVSPSSTADIARATRALLDGSAPPGLYHCVSSGYATWEEVGAEAARLLGLPFNARRVSLGDLDLRAPRPRFCALSNAKLVSAGVSMPTWQEALVRWLQGP